MCGIAGCTRLHGPPDEAVLERQLATLGHRGPDSSGHFLASRAAIGQTRLAVIDLATGDPPVHNEDGSVGVAFNGEIYNFRSLRSALESRGHRFGTSTDTEVLAHLAEECEPRELASRLHGMFAFAIWDGPNDRLILARDRLGKKPLYYYTNGPLFVFASEIKALLEHSGVETRIDVDAIPAYLAFGYVPTPRTFFEGITSVPPGHVLIVDRSGAVVVDPYWEPKLPGRDGVCFPGSFDDAVGRTRELLTAAVDRRLIADVPIGAFLSGGVDSSAVVGVMASLMDQPVKTFTIGFEDDSGFDERPFARRVSQRFGTEHTEFVVAPRATDLLEELVWHHDGPFGDSSAIPTYFLSKLTRGHVTVALSGDGGDELFAGYERFSAALALTQFQRLPRSARALGARGVAALPQEAFRGRVGSIQRFVGVADDRVESALRRWVAYTSDEWVRRLTGKLDHAAIHDYQRIWKASEGAPLLTRLLYLNLKTYLLDDLLVKVDRMTMAHALEVRSPLLDHELVEFALSLPPPMLAKGWSRKRVLKAAISDLVPSDLLKRRKRGFGIPLDRWFRHDLRSYLSDLLQSEKTVVTDFVSRSALDDLIAEHLSGKQNHGHSLWTLLTLEGFLRSRT